MDRRSNSNQNEKTFTIKGEMECIETAKRIISEKIQMPINFVNMSGGGPGGMSSNIPTVSGTPIPIPNIAQYKIPGSIVK